MKAMRRGNVRAASVAPAASTFAGGSIASSIGRAMTVPNPFRKVRRGICQVLFITMFYDRLTDETKLQILQTQATKLARRMSSRIVAADIRRRISARGTLPPRHLGGYGSCDDSHPNYPMPQFSPRSLPRLRHLCFFTAPHLERRALHDLQDQRRKTVAVVRQALGDLVHGAFVIILKAAAERVSQHLLSQAMHEVV